jgi:hypothetical protein
LFCVVLIFSAFIFRAFAADQPPGQAMTLSPTVIEKNVDPGQTITVELKLRNDLKTDLIFTQQINDFTSSDKEDEQGVPKIIFDESEPGPTSIRGFIQTTSDFLLKGKESKTIQVTIKVPQNASPGAHYGIVRFTGHPVDRSNQVDIAGSIGSIIFLNVNGSTKDNLKIEKYFTTDNNGRNTWLFTSGPVVINEWLKNTGNTIINPSGRVEIFDMFGKKVTELTVNGSPDSKEKPKYVLPDTTRKFHQKFDKSWMIGPYTAKMIVSYGSSNVTFADRNLTFWVIPWWLIIIFATVLTLIIWTIVRIRHKKKKNK